MLKRLGLMILPTLAASACVAGSSEDSSKSSAAITAPATLKAPAIPKVPQSANPYTLFETLQVRPLALSSDGTTLYALNTPDNRLEIFKIVGKALLPIGSVTVGLEPISLALRSDGEVWVVNHLSDSVSIVDVDDGYNARVVRTLQVGDEPRDIVFAGVHKDHAYITTAHRGQNSPDDPDLFVNVGRADVWVFDATNLGTAPGGQRVTKLTFFADTPRALAVTPDGKKVYAAAFFSGNQTTTVSEGAVSTVYPNGMPDVPAISIGGQILPQPPTGLIVKYTNGHWVDGTSAHAVWDPAVNVSLPDNDVFAIDATQNPPVAIASGVYSHVGTTLFNMAVNPKNGKVYVSNTDAHNDVRFEGHTPGFTSVAGNVVDSRLSVIDPVAGTVIADNLNTHLNHAAGTGNAALSVAFPQDLTFSPDGSKVYVVAQGSSKLAIYSTTTVEAGSAPPVAANQVALTGGGPTGVVSSGNLAFVLTRFDNAISVVDLGANKEASHHLMFNPEPASVTTGRKFLYDATLTSTLGDQACSSCHIGGDNDGLAWDLGNPGNIPLPITTLAASDDVLQTVSQSLVGPLFGAAQIAYIYAMYQPTKGPMTTQSLRGLDNEGAMHWRGDRNGAVQQTGIPFLSGGAPVVSAQPNSGIFDEVNAFKSFNVAFPGLVGDAQELSDADMTSYANFALQISYPPNPIRNLDNSLTPLQQGGEAFYFNNLNGTELPSDRFHDCNGCHTLDRTGNAGSSPHPGFFGTSGRLSFENESQIFKVPHLRNLYQKVGMYASSPDETHAVLSVIPQVNPPAAGVRGFGYQHDGATATIEQFLSAFVFVQTTVPVNFGSVSNIPPNPYGIPVAADPADPLNFANGLSPDGLALRRELASFVFAFDTNMFPVVGQQVTLTPSNASAIASRLALFEAQAAAGNTDLVVKGTIAGIDVGFVYSNGKYLPNVAELPAVTDAELRALVGLLTPALTYTCVPPGSGVRIGIDRDGDGYADGDEIARGSDPANPDSIP